MVLKLLERFKRGWERMVSREWRFGTCAYYGPVEMLIFGAVWFMCGLGFGYILSWYI